MSLFKLVTMLENNFQKPVEICYAYEVNCLSVEKPSYTGLYI